MPVYGLLVVFLTLALGGALVALQQRLRRARSTSLPAREDSLRLVRGVPSSVFVERDVLGGPKAGRPNRSEADLVLSPLRLLVATRHGRVLELTRERPGSVRCTGPRRLVIEGERPGEPRGVKVRVELILDDAATWADAAQRHLGALADAR